MRRGVCNVPLMMTWADRRRLRTAQPLQPGQLRARGADGAVLTVESSMRNVLPINMMAIAMGLHVRCGIEDNIWQQDRKAKMGTVAQIEQLTRISREFGREIATARKRAASTASASSTATPTRRWRRTVSRRTAATVSAAICSTPESVVEPTVLHRARAARPRLSSTGRRCWATLPRAQRAGRWAGVDLDCSARVAAIERAVQAIAGPVLFVAHSGGCIMVGGHWASSSASTRRRHMPCMARCLAAARLRDADARGLPDARRARRRRLAAGAARQPLPFRSLVAASRNDPLARLERRRRPGPELGQWR